MNNVKRNLLQIRFCLLFYVILYGVCAVLWCKDLMLYTIYNIEPSKFTIILSIVISLGVMILMFVKNFKNLVDWSKV